MNVNEYGNYLRFNVGEDISTNTNVLKLVSPSPVVKTMLIGSAEGLELGTVDIDIGDGVIFLANQYVQYKIKKDDIFLAETWTVSLTSEASDESFCKVADEKTFVVSP